MTEKILELAKNRKSTRKYSVKEVNIEDVLYSLDVARFSPSGANEQPWRFIIIDDKEVKKRVRDASERGEKILYDNVKGEFRDWLLSHGLSHRKPFLEEAPILIAVLMKKTAKYATESIWVAVGHMLLALEERGLNTLVYTPSNTEFPKKELEAPEGFRLEVIIPVGYSEDDSMKTSKHNLKEIVFKNRWETPI